MERVVCEVRVLAVLPTKELAQQVTWVKPSISMMEITCDLFWLAELEHFLNVFSNRFAKYSVHMRRATA